MSVKGSVALMGRVAGGCVGSGDEHPPIGFMPLAHAPVPNGPYTGGGVIAETPHPPAQILIDTFVAESFTDPARPAG